MFGMEMAAGFYKYLKKLVNKCKHFSYCRVKGGSFIGQAHDGFAGHAEWYGQFTNN
jgi:hypothetical protein